MVQCTTSWYCQSRLAVKNGACLVTEIIWQRPLQNLSVHLRVVRLDLRGILEVRLEVSYGIFEADETRKSSQLV